MRGMHFDCSTNNDTTAAQFRVPKPLISNVNVQNKIITSEQRACTADQIRMLHFYLQHCRGPFSLALSLRAYRTYQRYSAKRMQNSGVSPSHV